MQANSEANSQTNSYRIAVTSRSFSQNSILRHCLMQKYPSVSFNDSGQTLQGQHLISFLQNHDMAIIGLERLTADILAQLPKLKVISRFGVGIDNIDLAAVKAQNIRISHTPGANKRAVAELVIAFAILMLRKLWLANFEVRGGVWQQHKGQQLSEKTVGIIGFGAVGQELAALLKPFSCTIVAYDVQLSPRPSLERLLQTADVISVHLPFNASTKNLLDAKRLACMKQTAILINTSRGGIVDENAVKCMLKKNLLAGAAFDVFAQEPPQDQELLTLPNFFATPHLAGSTEEAILNMGFAAIAGLETQKGEIEL